jgi:sugar lactone lactonase YvrE
MASDADVLSECLRRLWNSSTSAQWAGVLRHHVGIPDDVAARASACAELNQLVISRPRNMHSDMACWLTFTRLISCGSGSQGGATGRLLKYSPKDGSTAVVAGNMWFPNGVALSEDLTFVAVAETTSMRVRRVYVAGPKV